MPKRHKKSKKEKHVNREQYLSSLQEKRSEQERRHETLNILFQLKKQEYSSNYDAIRTLVEKMNDYVRLGIDIELNIPFPEKNKIIKGKLPIYKNEEPVVFLTKME